LAVTHEQSLALVLNDLGSRPQIAEAVSRARNLRVRVRNLPGDSLCFVVMELVPGSETRVEWSAELPFESLPTAYAHFKATGMFEKMFRIKVKTAMEQLERVRRELGIELTIEEAIR
jgi:hypothetical protein